MRTALIAVRVTRAAAALTAVSALSVLSAPAASAKEEPRGTVWTTPSTAEPGAEVELRVHGCHGDRGVAKSPVFVSPAGLHGKHGHGLTGEAVISSHARPGWHTIHVNCDGQEGKATGSIRIVDHKGEHHRPDHHRPDHHRPDPHHTPRWPVHAGGGGMADRLPTAAEKKEPEQDGPGLPHTLIGAVLAGAATLAVAGRALRLRRRRSGE
ncbi:hypothetical protein [Streptomyces sp. NPDC012888]|uniref:hypothetical protein n=1 Tax=Streptomyces sp. NPDC012888 TaxID=3364855 RepID=UPI0036816196